MEQTLKVITKRDFPPNLQKKAINSKHIHIYNILRQQGKKKQYYKRIVLRISIFNFKAILKILSVKWQNPNQIYSL